MHERMRGPWPQALAIQPHVVMKEFIQNAVSSRTRAHLLSGARTTCALSTPAAGNVTHIDHTPRCMLVTATACARRVNMRRAAGRRHCHNHHRFWNLRGFSSISVGRRPGTGGMSWSWYDASTSSARASHS